MNTKTIELVNTYEKGKIVFFGEVDFDFTKHITSVKIIVDKIIKINLHIERHIIENNQPQKSIIKIPIVGKFILIKIKADFDLEIITVELLEDY